MCVIPLTFVFGETHKCHFWRSLVRTPTCFWVKKIAIVDIAYAYVHGCYLYVCLYALWRYVCVLYEGSYCTHIFKDARMDRVYPVPACFGEDDGCCTPVTPCDEGQGDCDTGHDCKTGLKCGYNNCVAPKSGQHWYNAGDDCCTPSEGVIVLGRDWCSLFALTLVP